MDIWQIITQSPLAAWLGYVHATRPSRKECDMRHENVIAAQAAMCTKLGEIQKDVREIREILITHVSKGQWDK